MEARKFIPEYSVRDWEQWEGRWELIDGIPVAMSPSPRPLHQIVSNNISTVMTNALSECRKCLVLSASDWKVAEDTVLQPDILVLCDESTDWKKEERLDRPPVLVVEILSPSTWKQDLGRKKEIYEREGVRYYLIADADKKEIQLFQIFENAYQSVYSGKGEKWLFDLDSCRMEIDLRKAWNKL